MKILIMGLPGSGKTTLAHELLKKLPGSIGFNADELRSIWNDWDFSYEGRMRQAFRMEQCARNTGWQFAVCDFVCPLPETRNVFSADVTIWLDTVSAGPYEDTNKAFVPPADYDFRITSKDAAYWSTVIAQAILTPVFDEQKPTVQMLGRFQPWHGGHRALFDRAIAKTGQVLIMVRNCPTDERNPYDFLTVRNNIDDNLRPDYLGKYKIVQVPNIVNITYGRDVGYTIEQEVFDTSITSISASKIRAAK